MEIISFYYHDIHSDGLFNKPQRSVCMRKNLQETKIRSFVFKDEYWEVREEVSAEDILLAEHFVVARQLFGRHSKVDHVLEINCSTIVKGKGLPLSENIPNFINKDRSFFYYSSQHLKRNGSLQF